jgi:DNA-binding transcriptional MocR family regulator
MSAAAVKWARAQVLPQTEKAVLMALAQAYSPRWGYSQPSQQKIADDIGVARETVNRVIARLVEKRLVTSLTAQRKKGQWDRRVYLLNPEGGGIPTAKKPRRRVTQDHTAPCDFHQTRHRVTQDHTSRRETFAKGEKTLSKVSIVSGGRA